MMLLLFLGMRVRRGTRAIVMSSWSVAYWADVDILGIDKVKVLGTLTRVYVLCEERIRAVSAVSRA
jgi:hypothetical protein